MMRQHHIALSRTLAGLAFAVALVLTPRVWVESKAESAIPVESLKDRAECVQCAPTEECSDAPAERDGLWLNPDQPLPGEPQPCRTPDGTSPGS